MGCFPLHAVPAPPHSAGTSASLSRLPPCPADPWDMGRTRQVGGDSVFFRGSTALCTQIVTQSFLSGASGTTVKNRLKISFIIHHLQTEIIFDNLYRKQAAFWLLASQLEGGKHMLPVSQSSREGPDNPLTPVPRERTQMCFWNKVTTLS